MKNILVALMAVVSIHGLAENFVGDVYKCPNGEYTNVYRSEQKVLEPAELIAKGCKRVPHPSDPVSVNGREQITIPVSKDGHFRLNGEINGKVILFLVDTGATTVSVGTEFAKYANIVGGTPISLYTANGAASGRIVKGISVTAGGFKVSNTEVVVAGSSLDVALLGQSFLSKFEMILNDRELILRKKK